MIEENQHFYSILIGLILLGALAITALQGLRWRKYITTLTIENVTLKNEVSALKLTINRSDVYAKQFQFILNRLNELKAIANKAPTQSPTKSELGSRLSTLVKSSSKNESSAVSDAASDDEKLNVGIKLFMNSQYTEALELLVEPAENGSKRAATLLAKMYFAGNGVQQNHDKYKYWLQKAADAGDRTAKAKLKKLSAQT